MTGRGGNVMRGEQEREWREIEAYGMGLKGEG